MNCTICTKMIFFVAAIKRAKTPFHKVIHTFPDEKWHKMDFSTKLSTLSTKIGAKCVDYFM